MACSGGSIIASVLEHLKLEDVQLLLENRGMPSIGGKEELTERLQVTLSGLQSPILDLKDLLFKDRLIPIPEAHGCAGRSERGDM